ncbi:MAG: tetratricopeptide repeat protein [Ignavibacteria bacterium]|jgi:tetratricopeptide (TPR) repeat protein|nr:tetratricopeptide repeat protein [Ignavibacteria bacterium]MDH7527115.1 tetratricopeptide repeat protein [Ignavibacteria bacterium]
MKTKKLKKDKTHSKLVIKKSLLFQNSTEKRLSLIFSLIPILISLGISIYYVIYQKAKNGFFSFPLDDPWIHLQFAKNLIEYGAYSYFKDQVITSGSTSPLYTFLAALIFLVIKNEFILSYLIGIIFFSLVTYFFFKLSKVEFKSDYAALILSILLAVQPKLGLISVSGMETTMFIFFLVASLFFYRTENFLMAGIFSGLSLWTRPEGLILIAVIIFDLALQKFYFKTEFVRKFFKQKSIYQFVIPVIFLSLVYFAFNFILSGEIFPNTYKAKLTYYLGSDRNNFLRRDVIDYFSLKEFVLVWIVFLLSVFFIIKDVIKKQYNGSFLYLVFVISFILIYYFKLPFTHRFGRYLMPVIPFYLILAFDGLQRFLMFLQQKSKTDQSKSLNVIYLVFVGFTLVMSVYQIPKNAEEIAFTGKYHYDRHIKIAEWLKQNTKPNEITATHDIGAIAFYSDRKIIDMVGLVNPEVIEHLNDKNLSDYLKNYFIKNDVSYFVTMRNWFEAVNQRPVYIPVNEFEFMEVFKFDPQRFHLMPKEASFYNQRALFFVQNGNYRAALDFLMRSLRLDPKSSRTLLLLGNVYDFLKDYDNAETYLKRAIELFPEYYEAHYELARVYFLQQKYDLAKESALKSLEYKPDLKEAIQLVITILENVEKNFDEAKIFRERLMKLQ